MEKMRAVVKGSEADTTFSIAEVRVPKIEEDELLVRISAIGVGIHDGYFLPKDMQYPYVLGIEAAGTVERIGSQVTGVAVGERIAFVSMMQPKGGTWAEYAAVSKDALMLKVPDDMTFNTAAAIPVAGNTVFKAFHALSLQQGDALFIAGASGAIGTFAIQLAKQRGIHVASSASLKNHAYMRSLGADFTVDYHDSQWPEQVTKWCPAGVTAALAIQPGTGKPSMAVVQDGGTVVPISDYQLQGERNISVQPLVHHTDVTEELTAMMKQITTEEMQLSIEKVYPFEEALDALQKTNTRRARGKVVIDLNHVKT